MKPADLHCIALVRRAQRAISRDFLLPDLSQYTARDAFHEAGELVVNQYFPRAVQRGNTVNVADLVELYVHAFVLAPLQYRLPGVFRPDWAHGTTLSWFRRCISASTGQFRWCEPVVDLDRSPKEVYRAFTSVVKIEDEIFARTASTVLCNLAASGGRKADAARLFLDPFAGAAFDGIINDTFHVRASGPVRRRLRAAGKSVASYLRIGDRAILLADVDSSKRTESAQFRWRDIREEPIRWQSYIIEWVKTKEHLRVRLDPKAVTAALHEIKALLESRSTTQFKHRAVVQKAQTFLHLHRHATGSLALLREFNQEVRQRVAKKITANVPSLEYPPMHVEVYDGLVLPISNPFLSALPAKAPAEPEPGVVSNATWMHIWNPYRATNAWASADIP